MNTDSRKAHNDEQANKAPFYGASSSDRWLQCPGSLSLQGNSTYLGKAAPRGTSKVAEEGAVLHFIASLFLQATTMEQIQELIEMLLATPVEDIVDEHGNIRELQYGAKTITVDDINTIWAYTKFLRSLQGDKAVEKEVSWSHYTDSDKSTGAVDGLAIFEKKATIVDLKLGKHYVDPSTSSAMKLYALGILEEHKEVEEVVLTVYQPTFDEPVTEHRETRTSLIAWANRRLVPAVKASKQDKQTFNEGSWCRFCPSNGLGHKAPCPAKANKA